MLKVDTKKGLCPMTRRHSFERAAIVLAGSLSVAGCAEELTGPTRQIESPSPQAGPLYTAATRGTVAQASFLQPVPAEPARIKPFSEWTEQDTAADALGRIGPSAVPALVQGLQSSDPDVRLRATEVLARMGADAKDAVPDLVVLLDDPDERIRKAAARTLGRIGPESAPAVPALMRSLLEAEPTAPPVDLQPVPPDE
jgi:HEAT repeat protein